MVLFLLAIVRSAGVFLINFAPSYASDLLQERLRNQLVQWIVNAPTPPNLTQTQALLGDTIPKTAQFANYASYLLPASLQMLALVGVMVALCPGESLVALGLLVGVGLGVSRLNRKVRALAQNLPQAQAVVVQTIERVAYNWLLVYVLGTQALEQQRFKTHAADFTQKSKVSHIWVCLTAAAAPCLGILILILVIFLSQVYFKSPASSLLTFLYLFVRFVQIGASATQWLGQLNAGGPFFMQTYRLFLPQMLEGRDPKPTLPNSAAGSGGKSDLVRPPALDLAHVCFAHGSQQSALFQDLHLHVPGGSQVGLVGPSGTGKSTLLHLILGVLRPQSGTVLLGGKPPSVVLKPPAGQPRLTLGYVGAEPFLFSGTWEENLIYGHPNPPSALILEEVLKRLQLHLTGSGQPRSLQDTIEVGGKNLSAGERQRLCFARAILAHPDILILDEVSANLDAVTESQMADLLVELKNKCTTLIVSHRPGILVHADRILDLERLK